MATSGINPVEEKEKGKSALENFATAMGILSSIGGLGISGFNMFKDAQAANAAIGANNAQKTLLESQNNLMYQNPFQKPLDWTNRGGT